MDYSPPGSSDHGILQARILVWVANHSLLQGIVPTQGLMQVSCIAGIFFTIWATSEREIWILNDNENSWGERMPSDWDRICKIYSDKFEFHASMEETHVGVRQGTDIVKKTF